jgi:hypothetical protein
MAITPHHEIIQELFQFFIDTVAQNKESYHMNKIDRNQTLFDKVFRDSEGKIVIAQMPNIPVVVWFVASLLKLIFTTGNINLGLDVIAFGSLLIWACLELFQGVNYFRRALGLLVLVGLIASKIQYV